MTDAIAVLPSRNQAPLEDPWRRDVQTVAGALGTDEANGLAIPADTPAELVDDGPLDQPVEEQFRASAMHLGWDPRTAQVVLEVFPVEVSGDEEDTPGPEADLATRRGVYDCLVFVRSVPATETNIGGQVGYPFRAVLDFERFSVTWCKTNPVPGERVVPDPRTVLELPKPCRAAASG